MNTIIQRKKTETVVGIRYDVAQACLEIANRKASGESWDKINEQLNEEINQEDNKIKLLKDYITSKFLEEAPDLENWSLEKIYAYVLCGIGVCYLPNDPLRGYFIISLSNVGHHILGQNKEPLHSTASLPSFITLCMGMIQPFVKATKKRIAINMHQLICIN